MYLAAAMEYMASEILELAGTAAKQHKKSRINPRHIMLAVRGDEELNSVFKDVTIAAGGVPVTKPHKSLLPKNKRGDDDN